MALLYERMKITMRPVLLVVAGVALLFASACKNDPPCASGTREVDGECVADAVTLSCGPGTRLDADRCMPVPQSTLSCGAGTHAEDGRCVADVTLECGANTRVENGHCVPTFSCPAGTHLEGETCVADAPPATWTANIRVSPEGVQAYDPAIVADADGHVWVSFLEFSGQQLSVQLYGSSDAGKTFTLISSYAPSTYYVGRPSLATSGAGHVALIWTDYKPQTQSTHPADVMFIASSDYGFTWSVPQKLNQDDGSVYNDQPRLTVGANGELHAHFLTEITQGEYRTHHLRSSDFGATWSTPTVLPAAPPAFNDFTYAMHASPGAVTANGTLVIPEVVHAYYARSQSVGFVHLAATASQFDRTPIEDVFSSNEFRVDAQPLIAASATGRNCFAFVDAPSRDSGIFVSVADGNLAFGKPKRLDQGIGSVQTKPALVADAEGRCHAIWLDNRSGEWEVWGATVLATGRSPQTRRCRTRRSWRMDRSSRRWGRRSASRQPAPPAMPRGPTLAPARARSMSRIRRRRGRRPLSVSARWSRCNQADARGRRSARREMSAPGRRRECGDHCVTLFTVKLA